ncbi:hypothetical protein TIFTF001_017164 [Ficus carica]|uniref:Uncharacterized protein n=1 Tax=Ficus carica TaxID=3494 RepID=A0AA88ABN7_FICCA|nr:hypothetical protein TIFTF001_017164 [Ficus carica]
MLGFRSEKWRHGRGRGTPVKREKETPTEEREREGGERKWPEGGNNRRGRERG